MSVKRAIRGMAGSFLPLSNGTWKVTPPQPFVQLPEGSRVALVREGRDSAVVVEPFDLGVFSGDLKFQVGRISAEENCGTT